MAEKNKRLEQNVSGEFYVDSSCIDCDACRRIAPASFTWTPDFDQSCVFHQPETDDERLRALMALVACPTSSIGTESGIDIGPGVEAFPEPAGEGIYFCGFTAESSFGASSYLIRRDDGNVLVDSPRAAEPLLKKLRAMGGVRYMFLSHRDDVADHKKFHREFGCDRILHRGDVTRHTKDVEMQIEGEEPTSLADDLIVIPLPGHTLGSAALLYRNEILFTGDHLWWSPREKRLMASPAVCWYSWPEQIRSMERLLDYRFTEILPGHGRPYRAESAEAMRGELVALIEWMKK
ncbi:MAG: MBL fold metallo-hydrolase [Planctomycetota bacterium]|nr:MBL fold metallo-hydrolase [Planctomycetota bacterium]